MLVEARSLGTDLSPDDVAGLRRIIESSGAAAQVEAVIDELATHAVRSLDRAGLDEHATEVLRGLAAAATQRAV